MGLGAVVRGRGRCYLPEQFPFARLTPQTIDRTLAGGGRDPAAGIGRKAIPWPPAQRNCERFLDRVFGNVDVAENADQGGDRPARVLAKDVADSRLVNEHQNQAVGSSAKSANGRTSIGTPMQRVTFDAQVKAASRSSELMT